MHVAIEVERGGLQKLHGTKVVGKEKTTNLNQGGLIIKNKTFQKEEKSPLFFFAETVIIQSSQSVKIGDIHFDKKPQISA